MPKYIIYIFLCLLAVSVRAQNYTTGDKKAIKLYEKGQTALYQGNGDEAVRCFEQALAVDGGFLEAHLMLAEWFFDTRKPDQARSHYRAVVDANPSFFPAAWLQLGKLELADGNYDKAESDFSNLLKYETKDKSRREEAQQGIETARFRKNAIANPVPFKPVNLGANVNTAADEYLPSLTVDGQQLVFTRRAPRKAGSTAKTSEEEDFYISTRIDDASAASKAACVPWGKAVRMPEPLNSSDNEGAGCVSQDGRILFFTACERRDGGGRCDIYMCVRRGDQWGKPRNLGPAVNSGAWEAQPTFSIDGKTLYFVSDRKGGYGGTDIWKTVFENGRWSTPENLGPTINTKGNEHSPFIHYDDQTLYFSSDGHVGMGGMDIFVSRRQSDGTWGTPVNLGYPINTDADESNLIVDASSQTAYYSSDREGGYGKQDIYSFEMPVASRPIPSVCFKGTVTDAKTGKKVAADIKVVNLSSGEVVANTSSDAQNGNYIVSLPSGHDYAFMVTADGYLFYSQNQPKEASNHFNVSTYQHINDIALQPIEVGSRLALRNVFFETGKYALLPQSEYELGRVVDLLQKNPTLRVEIGGHTDNVGQDAANQTLSENRAKAVYNYIINKGVGKERLQFKGYGETQPVAPNDTDEGRAANRRVEMKIL